MPCTGNSLTFGRHTVFSVKTSERNQVLRSPYRVIDLSSPAVMAIINATPDSFYFASRYNSVQAVVERVGEAVEQGALMIDMGGMSSRPGAPVIEAAEEINRLLPNLEAIRSTFPELWISIDTWRAEVVHACAPFQIDMVNDISGGRFDPDLWPTVAKYSLSYVLMHMPNPLDKMHQKQHYDDIIREVCLFFHEKIIRLVESGIREIVLDPGFGFGKSLDDNYALLDKMNHFAFLEYPILAGVSRKSMIQKVLGVDASQALNGTTALHMVALIRGARILRVHDVVEASQCSKLHAQLSNSSEL